MRTAPAPTLTLLVSLGLGACGSEELPAPPGEVLSSTDAIRAGRILYEKNCSICHGLAGHGDGPQAKSLNPSPSDLRNLSGPRAEPGYWFLRIKQGGKNGPLPRERSAMPAWGEHLTDDQIWELVAYMKSFGGDRA